MESFERTLRGGKHFPNSYDDNIREVIPSQVTEAVELACEQLYDTFCHFSPGFS